MEVTLIYNKISYSNYRITDTGMIRSVDRELPSKTSKRGFVFRPGRVLKSRKSLKFEHLFVEIHLNQKRKTIYVHKAVFESFGGIIKDYVSHKDGNVSNNLLRNLYTVTHSELQIRNMNNYPHNRWRLSEINTKSGYYKNCGRSKVNLSEHMKTKICSMLKTKTYQQVSDVFELSISYLHNHFKQCKNK